MPRERGDMQISSRHDQENTYGWRKGLCKEGERANREGREVIKSVYLAGGEACAS